MHVLIFAIYALSYSPTARHLVSHALRYWRNASTVHCDTGAMHVILNGEPREEVGCFKYLGTQVAADGGCEKDVVHRMNGGY